MSLPSRTALYWYYSALGGYFGLFLLLMSWPTILLPSARFPVALILLFSVTPLLLPLRGFLHGKTRSCSWLAYISLFYLIHGIVEAYAEPLERCYAALEILFSLLLFFGTTFYVRYYQKTLSP